jgi:hypothetical protein
MNQPTFDEPEVEAAARAAQIAAMSVTVIEALARLRAQQTAERADADARQAAAARAQRQADHAAARVAWSPAHDDGWLRSARLDDLGRAWSAATMWAATDPGAARAAERVEARLTSLHPAAMNEYRRARTAGDAPAEAMAKAAPHFAVRVELVATSTAPEKAPPKEPREPRVVAADAYPRPVNEALEAPVTRGGSTHVVTTVPERRATAAHR